MPKLLVFVVLLVACTKPNPNLCCTDEADCDAAGLPHDSTCAAGLVCRGHQCISEPCTTASQCEASAPYCVADLCAEACSDDLHCPGLGQRLDEVYCVDGSCHECRPGLVGDCGATTPVCDQGSCRACMAHHECDSGVCSADGRCADDASVAYVDTTGSTASECTRLAPCSSIARALDVTPPRKYVLVSPGTYPSSVTIRPVAERWIIGSGASPVLTRSTPGPLVTVGGGSVVTLENLELVNATGVSGSDDQLGYGILCALNNGTPTLNLKRVTVRESALAGVYGVGCILTATDSSFLNNGNDGVRLSDGTATFDRCLFTGHRRTGMDLDGGLYSVTNSFVVRNSGESAKGIALYSTNSGHRIEFNTIADNIDTSSVNVGAGFQCNLSAPASFPNNIIVRNTRQTSGPACTYPSSIILDSDVGGLKFKSPDAAPFDYHITAGSIAIDAATASTLDHDFDGEPRAAPRDVGADEYRP